MALKKNAAGLNQYCYKKTNKVQKIIQKDWLKEHKYTPDHFPPEFFENIEEKLTPGKLGYWAYAIDGDGWISTAGKKNKKFTVGITLKDREPIQELADIYGTSISRIDHQNKNWKPLYTTQLYGKRALHFLRFICPYMTEKRKKATQCINRINPNYHPPKIHMDFKKNSDLITYHMGMIGGFFDTEGSVGMKVGYQKYKTKLGDKVSKFRRTWVHFTNTDLRPIRKIKKILETWPFNFKPIIYGHQSSDLRKDGKPHKKAYKLTLPAREELLFMKMFSPWILITRKREYADKFELKNKYINDGR